MNSAPVVISLLARTRKQLSKAVMSTMGVVKKLKLDPEENGEETDHKSKYVIRDETEIGIEEFLSKHSGFHGLIKHRYSDFIVHEITEEDEIVKLTSVDPPPLPQEPSIKESEAILAKLLPEDTVDQLNSLMFDEDLSAVDGDEPSKPKDVRIDVTDRDKEWRKTLHRAIAIACKGLFTNTQEENGIKVMIINRNKQRRKEWPFPGDFTHFVVYQENRGTMSVVGGMSRIVQNNQKSFLFAGTKDKRAISSQRMCCYRLHPRRLLKVNDVLMRNIFPVAVGNISFKKHDLKLGQSHGNHFQIVLRSVREEKEGDIKESFERLAEDGFINYYGSQRFGLGSVRTDRIGKFILQDDWKGAVENIMKPKNRDMKSPFGSFNELMTKWQETRDSASIGKNFYWRDSNEGIILRELTRDPNNFKNAILSLPRNNRHMYVHAYQSWIWNRTVSERVRRHGSKVLTGDLLVSDSVAVDQEEVEDDNKNSRIEPTTVDESAVDSTAICDVVIPLPGSGVRMPANDTGDIIQQLLNEDGVPLSAFSGNNNSFNIYGGYRKMIVKPKDLNYETTNYKDETVRLFQSDLEILTKVDPEKELLDASDENVNSAVKLEVSLPSSSYATVFVRELMRHNEAEITLL